MIKQRFLSSVLLFFMILGTWKGYVALFQEGREEPRQIFPTLTASLPPEDQASLEAGIIVRSDYVLQQLLEDYLS